MKKKRKTEDKYAWYKHQIKDMNKDELQEEAAHQYRKRYTWALIGAIGIVLFVYACLITGVFYYELDEATDIMGYNTCQDNDLGYAVTYRRTSDHITLTCSKGILLFEGKGEEER